MRSRKTIETGRVDKGSHSNQQIQTVQKDFETFPFYTMECKLLPESQKVVTASEATHKSYCTQCGHKVKSDFKFCPSCGSKV